jgi:predicted nucleic acid-binding protein
VINDDNAILEAIDIERQYTLSFWDALIVQAANVAGAPILYSEDLGAGQIYGGTRVVNPLVI